MLHDGKLNFYWIQVNNNLQADPNINEETYPGFRNPDNFIVVSDAYPTVTALAADLILPSAMWGEKEGAYGNAERLFGGRLRWTSISYARMQNLWGSCTFTDGAIRIATAMLQAQ